MNGGSDFDPARWPGLADAVAQAVRARGGKGSREIAFRCPCPDNHQHGDRKPSASYNRAENVWICQGCGASGGLLDLARLLGIEPDAFDNRRNGTPTPQHITPSPTPPREWAASTEPPAGGIVHRELGRPAVAWQVRGDRGRLFGIHARWNTPEGKTLRWWRNGEWGLDGLPLADAPLYRADLLAFGDPEAVVVVAEGEKAADALAGLGLVALGTVTGASGTPGPQALDVLRSRKVVLFPDADEPGRAHMGRIAEALRGVAADVRLFSPAGLPDKGDACEWIAGRPETWGDAELIAQLIAEAGPVEITTAPTPAPQGAASPIIRPARCYNLAEFLALELPPPEPILSPWLNMREAWMIFGWRGTGKSHVALGITYAAATGGSFLRWKAPKPRRVVLIDGENTDQELQRRFASICRSDPRIREVGGLLKENVHLITAMGQDVGEHLRRLDTPEGQAQVEPHLAGADLVVLDNLSTLFSAAENEADDWDRAQSWMLGLRRRGIAVAFFHHAGKGGQQRGTSRREDALMGTIKLERPSDYRAEQGARFVVSFEKSRGLYGRDMAPFEAALTTDPDGLATWVTTDAAGFNREKAVEMMGTGMGPQAVAAELAEPVSNVYRWRKQALERGELKEPKGSRKGGG